jgi:hypothetical protein
MQTIALIIVLQVVVTLLTGCTEFQTKMDMMKSEQMTCAEADESLCAGWKV